MGSSAVALGVIAQFSHRGLAPSPSVRVGVPKLGKVRWLGLARGTFHPGKIQVACRALVLAFLPWLIPPLWVGFVQGAEIDEAIECFRSGRYAECAELAGRQIEQRAYSENWRLLKLQSELAIGRYADALETLDKALQDFPTSIRLRWWGHAVCRFNRQAERAETLLNEIDEFVARAAWRYRDSDSRVTLGRYYLSRGVDPRRVLEATIDPVKKDDPQYVDAFLAAAQLALDKHDYQLAAEELGKALKLDDRNADVLFALARAYAPSEQDRAETYLLAALTRNPNHVDGLLMLADRHIDAERYDEAREALTRILEFHPSEPRAWAYRAVLAHLENRPDSEAECRRAALAWWATNPEVDYLIGRKLSQKYRFAEGAACQRRALELDAAYLPAKIQLSQDLLRLGQVEEGWQLAQEVYQQDGYNIVAHNLVTLQDELAKYQVLRAEGLAVRMEVREADLYGGAVLELLQRARDTLCAKYEVQLPDVIHVEIFPRQQDFAVRTFGLPGGDGFLGVCFGNVVTANSPASQGESPANWQSVLWHEFCHVVTLRKTHNRMPRWLSEGVSVYEERQADARWGQSMKPRYREMILGGQLTPVSQLSAAFLQPPSPLHLDFAYFESSLVVEFIMARHGLEALKQILTDLGDGVAIHEALSRHVGPAAQLDAEFDKFAREQAERFAPGIDWQQPRLEANASSSDWAQWNLENPNNYYGLLGQARRLIQEKQWEAALVPLERLLKLYPGDAAQDGAYALLATVHRERGNTEAERSAWEELTRRSSDASKAHLRLMEIYAEASDWENLQRQAVQLLAINPLIPAPHRSRALAAERLDQPREAVAALQALVRLDPTDVADVHFRLASGWLALDDLSQARRHVLMSLEEAPRFRAAHRLLLEICERSPKGDVSPARP